MKFAESLFLNAKTEKIDLLKEFCGANKFDLFTVILNVPESKEAELDQFLIENNVIMDEEK